MNIKKSVEKVTFELGFIKAFSNEAVMVEDVIKLLKRMEKESLKK